MQGLTNDIKSSYTCRSGPKDWVLPSSLDRKLLDTCTRFEKGKGLPRSSNPVNYEQLAGGRASTASS